MVPSVNMWTRVIELVLVAAFRYRAPVSVCGTFVIKSVGVVAPECIAAFVTFAHDAPPFVDSHTLFNP